MLKSVDWTDQNHIAIKVIDDEFIEKVKANSIYEGVIYSYLKRNKEKEVARNLVLAIRYWKETYSFNNIATMVESCNIYLDKKPEYVEIKEDFQKYLALL